MSAIVSLIVAADEGGVIGEKGKLPWRIPEDMRWFKENTLGKPCIMGRKTWDSLPKKPLPQRVNIVVSRMDGFIAAEAKVARSVEAALAMAMKEGADEIMVIGGAEIYRAALPLAQRIYLTSVHGRFQGDAYFPVLDKGEWDETTVSVQGCSDLHPIGYSFIILNRKAQKR